MEIPHENENLNISGYGLEIQLESKGFINFESLAFEIIKVIANKIIKEGAKEIGHIKLYIKGKNGFIKADTIGLKYGIHIDGFISPLESLITLILNVIVIGIEREKLVEIINESINELIKIYNLTIIKK